MSGLAFWGMLVGVSGFFGKTGVVSDFGFFGETRGMSGLAFGNSVRR